MKKTFVLLLAFAIIISGMGFSMAADNETTDANHTNGITVSSLNANLQEQVADPGDPGDPNKIPLQKTGLPVAPALLSTLLIGSGLLYGRLRN